MYDYLLFDLDGTLTDPKEGITKSVQYALKAFGIEEPDLDKLEPFIGPPLKNSFMEFYGFDEAKAEEAVEKYRENFKDVGIFQNQVYDGIPQMLRKLKVKGKHLAVSSSKPQVFVERILDHFDLRKYFDVVVGSELDGRRVEKEEVVEEALRQLLGGRKYSHDEVVIVGDRKFDVEGGLAHGITTVAVSYGYGSMEELKEAKAEYIVRSVQELEKTLLRGSEDMKYEPGFNKIWQIIFPVLIGYFMLQIGSYAGTYVVAFLADKEPSWANALVAYDEAGKLNALTGTGAAIMNLVAFLLTGFVMFQMGKTDIKKAAKEAANLGKAGVKTYLWAVPAVVAAALGINVLFNLLGFMDKSVAFTQMQEQRYSAPLALALVLYGVAAPVAEEFLFRGIVYNRTKKYMGLKAALFVSAALFAIYHGNLISGIYAFLMGLLITYLYEKTGNYLVPVAAHMIANVCTYVLSYTGVLDSLLFNWAAWLVLLAVGAGSTFMLIKSKDGLI